MTELTITIRGTTESGEDSSYKQKFLLYDPFEMTENDPTIKQCIEQSLANSKITPDDIKVRALLVVK